MSIKILKRVVMDKVDKRLWKSLNSKERGDIRRFVFSDEFIKNTSFEDVLKILPRDFSDIFKNKLRKKAWVVQRDKFKNAGKVGETV